MLSDPKSVPEVKSVSVIMFDTPTGPFLLVQATGVVPTSGWSGIALSPQYNIAPPEDGILVFDLIAHIPVGPVLQVISMVSAETIEPAPDWLKGVTIRGSTNSVTTDKIENASRENTINIFNNDNAFTKDERNYIFNQTVAVYDDSFQPIGLCSGFGSIKMKKLRHEITLIIEGPDESKIRRCFEESVAAGLIAGIAAVFLTGGLALSAALAAFKSYLIQCLADSSFEVRIERSSHWIEWCT